MRWRRRGQGIEFGQSCRGEFAPGGLGFTPVRHDGGVWAFARHFGAARASARHPMKDYAALLRAPGFRAFWLALMCNNPGSWCVIVILPILVVERCGAGLVLRRDEYPVRMGRTGSHRTALVTIRKADNHTRVARALSQCGGPKLQPRRVRSPMQCGLIQCGDEGARAQRAKILLEFGRTDKALSDLRDRSTTGQH
jgi:hypothetical protein